MQGDGGTDTHDTHDDADATGEYANIDMAAFGRHNAKRQGNGNATNGDSGFSGGFSGGGKAEGFRKTRHRTRNVRKFKGKKNATARSQVANWREFVSLCLRVCVCVCVCACSCLPSPQPSLSLSLYSLTCTTDMFARQCDVIHTCLGL